MQRHHLHTSVETEVVFIFISLDEVSRSPWSPEWCDSKVMLVLTVPRPCHMRRRGKHVF